MPLVPQEVVNSVFYLYENEEDAKRGRNPGGTGFVVRYDGVKWFEPNGGPPTYYGVTNWHVACSRGFSVIRLNQKDGGVDIIELGPEDWHFLPGRYDVAIVPIVLDQLVHNVSSISTLQFLQPPQQMNYFDYVGIGDDVFMIGLFIDHGGAAINVPSARFGNVSMLPNPKATIKQSTGYMGESFVVDMHSRTGFSGSPVYVFRTFGSDLTSSWGHEFEELELDSFGASEFGGSTRFRGRLRARGFFKLLGIHWGQFPEKWELKDKSSLEESRQDLIVEGAYVEGMSGMTCVIPSWQMMEVLEMPALKKLRLQGAT